MWATEDGSWLPKQVGEDFVPLYGSYVLIVYDKNCIPLHRMNDTTLVSVL